MEKNFYALLKDRALIKISGFDAEDFLQNLLTIDVKALPLCSLYPAALLSPQGKILFDFLIARLEDGFLIDIKQEFCADFSKKINLYKLRAKISVEILAPINVALYHDLDQNMGENSDNTLFCLQDARFPDNLQRFYMPRSIEASSPSLTLDKWETLRIKHGIAEGDKDFLANSLFPFDIHYDLLGGLALAKGCYIGQEVISRMYNRSTIRKRPLVLMHSGPFPDIGTPIKAGDKIIGTLGSHCHTLAIAIMRLDHVQSAIDQNISILLEDSPVGLYNPIGQEFLSDLSTLA